MIPFKKSNSFQVSKGHELSSLLEEAKKQLDEIEKTADSNNNNHSPSAIAKKLRNFLASLLEKPEFRALIDSNKLHYQSVFYPLYIRVLNLAAREEIDASAIELCSQLEKLILNPVCKNLLVEDFNLAQDFNRAYSQAKERLSIDRYNASLNFFGSLPQHEVDSIFVIPKLLPNFDYFFAKKFKEWFDSLQQDELQNFFNSESHPELSKLCKAKFSEHYLMGEKVQQSLSLGTLDLSKEENNTIYQLCFSTRLRKELKEIQEKMLPYELKAFDKNQALYPAFYQAFQDALLFQSEIDKDTFVNDTETHFILFDILSSANHEEALIKIKRYVYLALRCKENNDYHGFSILRAALNHDCLESYIGKFQENGDAELLEFFTFLDQLRSTNDTSILKALKESEAIPPLSLFTKHREFILQNEDEKHQREMEAKELVILQRLHTRARTQKTNASTEWDNAAEEVLKTTQQTTAFAGTDLSNLNHIARDNILSNARDRLKSNLPTSENLEECKSSIHFINLLSELESVSDANEKLSHLDRRISDNIQIMECKTREQTLTNNQITALEKDIKEYDSKIKTQVKTFNKQLKRKNLDEDPAIMALKKRALSLTTLLERIHVISADYSNQTEQSLYLQQIEREVTGIWEEEIDYFYTQIETKNTRIKNENISKEFKKTLENDIKAHHEQIGWITEKITNLQTLCASKDYERLTIELKQICTDQIKKFSDKITKTIEYLKDPDNDPEVQRLNKDCNAKTAERKKLSSAKEKQLRDFTNAEFMVKTGEKLRPSIERYRIQVEIQQVMRLIDRAMDPIDYIEKLIPAYSNDKSDKKILEAILARRSLIKKEDRLNRKNSQTNLHQNKRLSLQAPEKDKPPFLSPGTRGRSFFNLKSLGQTRQKPYRSAEDVIESIQTTTNPIFQQPLSPKVEKNDFRRLSMSAPATTAIPESGTTQQKDFNPKVVRKRELRRQSASRKLVEVAETILDNNNNVTPLTKSASGEREKLNSNLRSHSALEQTNEKVKINSDQRSKSLEDTNSARKQLVKTEKVKFGLNTQVKIAAATNKELEKTLELYKKGHLFFSPGVGQTASEKNSELHDYNYGTRLKRDSSAEKQKKQAELTRQKSFEQARQANATNHSLVNQQIASPDNSVSITNDTKSVSDNSALVNDQKHIIIPANSFTNQEERTSDNSDLNNNSVKVRKRTLVRDSSCSHSEQDELVAEREGITAFKGQNADEGRLRSDAVIDPDERKPRETRSDAIASLDDLKSRSARTSGVANFPSTFIAELTEVNKKAKEDQAKKSFKAAQFPDEKRFNFVDPTPIKLNQRKN